MKRISLLVTSLILFCGWAVAQNAKISFNESEHDFGVIGEKNGNATFNFVFTNNSSDPIVITNAIASCGCTKPVWTKEPIEPGKQGSIEVSYNPVGRIGAFDKTITVYLNNDQSAPAKVKIKGTVVQSDGVKKKPEDEYPVALGKYLLKTKDLNFGQVNWKKAKSISLDVFNSSDSPITQTTMKLPKDLTVNFNPVTIPAKTAGVMVVTLNVQDNNSYGDLLGDFTLLVNNVRQSFPFSATVIDDFSQLTPQQKANAGKINVTPSEVKFSNISASGGSQILKVANSGKSALNIRSIQSTDPEVTVSKSHFVVNPGQIVDVKVNVKKTTSGLSAKLSIISDDPNTPIYVLSVSAVNK